LKESSKELLGIYSSAQLFFYKRCALEKNEKANMGLLLKIDIQRLHPITFRSVLMQGVFLTFTWL